MMSMKQSLFCFLAVLTTLLSCGHQEPSVQKMTEAESLIYAARNAGDYERVRALTDSLEKTGDISPIMSSFFRGDSYVSTNNLRLAKEALAPVLDLTPTNAIDSSYFFSSERMMVEVLSLADDHEGVLHVALPLIEGLRELHNTNSLATLGVMYQKVGIAQMSLGMENDAAKSFDLSFNSSKQYYASNPSWQSIGDIFTSAYNIALCYFAKDDFPTAEKWVNRQDSIITLIQDRNDVPSQILDIYVSLNCSSRAILASCLKKPAEANRAIDEYQKTAYSKTVDGQVDGAVLLVNAERYAEAADGLEVLDQYFTESGLELSLDNIANFYGGKFKANYRAGRRDSALAVAAYVFENLDTAISKQKNSAAAELATVYQTQQKDAEIAQQQISLSRQRWIGTLAALVLITTFFMIYTWYRRRAQKRLAVAHSELKSAYDQLEETTAAKERIESELRIARDIQMSMVPNDFPEYEGLDMYAEMNAAKEVGGDLYGYVLQGNQLHFCLGDVSGKGVPASLFMSQSARLFRTLATEGLSPVDIAVRMNNELAENNDRGMFVTMFIGRLHLDTGRLDFCNCGHNPPVLDGQFLEMQYDNQPLGLWEDDPFYGETIDDVRGRQLLVYTDGLNEAENKEKQLLGNQRLLELMADTASLTSHEVVNRLKDAVEQHRAGAEPNDDLTLMCIRLKK